MAGDQVQASPAGENVRVSGVSLRPIHWAHLDALAEQDSNSRSATLRAVISKNILARRVAWSLKHDQVTRWEAGCEILALFL